MINKKVIPSKNISIISNRMTGQELQVRELLQSENIFFSVQQVFMFTDCRYIVDFFLDKRIIMECASTSMYKYQIPLRKKAIHLEAKISHIKEHYPTFLVWVLFETHRPILETFFQTLVRLMPSVDQIFLSQEELREALQATFGVK
jgi:hypothetical protein